MEDKWVEFRDDRYRLANLGRPALFLVPSHKLRFAAGDVTVEERLHKFLASNFGAFTTSTLPTIGFWRDGAKRMVYDECRQYEVSFAGKQKIPVLLCELAEICRLIGEDCLYFKAGQYACLVYPMDVLSRILEARGAIRRHRDTRGDDRCWLDDFLVWIVLPDTVLEPSDPPPYEEAMERCRLFYVYRRSDTLDPVPGDAILDPAHWDDDLATMTAAQLVAELDRIRAAIRQHRSRKPPLTIDDDRALYAVLPEKLPADFRLTPEEEFLGGVKPGAGCPNFWRSHQHCGDCPHNLHRWGPCTP